jgi:murein DD-endopeptidase MepM/ murein hydrolase activator NlpD
MKYSGLSLILVMMLILSSCVLFQKNSYERGEFVNSPNLKHSIIPLSSGTPFVVRQGAFGISSHNEAGNTFQWDLEVPLDTPILSVDDGLVLYLYQPEGAKGGCNPEYALYAWGLHIEHDDRTVAQYLHVLASVKVGQRIKKGDVIGRTVWLGWICYPHVHFGIYSSRYNMYGSPNRETLPIYFEGIEDGLLKEGERYITP